MKRILSSILCGALITGLFGGCGGENGECRSKCRRHGGE